MTIAALVETLLAAGVDHATIVAAVKAVETKEPARTARQERNARYYEARKERLNASENRLKTSYSSPERPSTSSSEPLSSNQNPSSPPIVPPPRKSRSDASEGVSILLDACVPPEVLADWQAVRKAKKAGPITATVANALIREADKAGMLPGRAVAMAAERGWQGFQADWVANAPRAGPAPRQKSVIDHLKELDHGNDQSILGGFAGFLPGPERG